MADTTQGRAADAIAALADQCVMCGLCLPHCPTYRLDRHESESPRGRIVLARQLARGAVPADEASLAHLDRCLGCLSCQAVCPSQVRYEDILTQTRVLLAPGRPRRGHLRRWLTRTGSLRRLATLGAVLHADRWLPRLAGLLPAGSVLRRLAEEVPSAPSTVPMRARRASETARRGRVILFPGCVASVHDRDTLAGARVLLAALGYAVVEPRTAVCCGALALHAGDSADAASTRERTRAALEALDAERVLVSASGCLGGLRHHTLDGSRLQAVDIMSFIATDSALESLSFRPLEVRAALHLPCTQSTVGDGGAPIRRLLGRIPGLRLLELPSQPGCCGAAGSYFIEQPERADRLRSERLAQIDAQAPDLVLTTNIGCRIFLGNGLRRTGSAAPVLHPLALLARQLDTAQP